QNIVGQFVSNPLIRNILGQPVSAINLRRIMDEKKILIVNLSKGRIGEDNMALLGSMLITRLQLAAMSRVDVPEEERNDFYLYVDEFQNFATESFAAILSEARKYRLVLILAHQYIEQLSEEVRAAVFGNMGSLALFRIGAGDAEFLEKEFMPEFLANDLLNLPKYHVYMKLMIDGMASHAFSATVIPPYPKPEQAYRDVIIENSRRKYGTPRRIVDEKIAGEWEVQSGKELGEQLTQRRAEQSLATALKPRPQRREGERKEVNRDALRAILNKTTAGQEGNNEHETNEIADEEHSG
ncbi:MAG: TraM recognition domain-containing protein, partial [Candidatus Liptonbacteria bacterium]|nr:TraM recognition domain-containing protein [Candidatus Liptonbacteria bacterium]